MSLREMLNSPNLGTAPQESPAVETRRIDADALRLKSEIHLELLKKFDLTVMEKISDEELRQRLAVFVEETLQEKKLGLSESQRKTLVTAIQNEVMGLGPLEPLLADDSVSDILVNGPHTVYVERRGKL